MSITQRIIRATGLAVWLVGGGTLSAAYGQAEPRVIWKSGAPIAEQLQPGDTFVVVKEASDSRYRPPAGRDPVFGVDTPDTHLVAVVRLERATGMLAEDGRWINTSFVGSIRDTVFARREVPSGAGLTVEFQTYGGSVTMGSAVVSTERRQRLTVGSDYLVFLQNAGHAFYYTTGEILEVKDGLLVLPPPSPGDVTPPGSGVGMRLADALASIRRFGAVMR